MATLKFTLPPSLLARQLFCVLAAGFWLTACAQVPPPEETPAPTPGMKNIVALPPVEGQAADYLSALHANRINDFDAASGFIANLEQPTETLRAQNLILRVIRGDMPGAISESRDMLKDEKPEDIAYLIQAVNQAKEGQYGVAREIYQQTSNSHAGVFIKPMLMAWLEAGRRDRGAAFTTVAQLSKIQALKPLQDLHSALLHIYFDDPAAAEPFLQSVMENISEPNIRYIMLLLDYYLERGQTDKARELIRSVQELDPESEFMMDLTEKVDAGQPFIQHTAQTGLAQALYDIGTIFAAERRPRQGLFYAQMARYLDGENPVYALFIASLYRQLQRYDDANAVYDEAIFQTPSLRFAGRYRQAENMFLARRNEDALARLAELEATDPGRSSLYVLKGDILRQQEKFLEAADAYTQALERISAEEPRHWSLYYARGIAYERAKLWPQAEADLKKSLELNPNQASVLNYLGYSWVDMGINIQEGKDLILKAVTLEPNNGYIVDSLGWALYKLGDYAGAVKYLERAVLLAPSDPTIVDHYGDALWKVGRQTEARYMWSQALSFKPDAKLEATLREKLLNGLTS